MKVQYTKKEMVALARLTLGFGHSRDDVELVQTDGPDVDSLLAGLTRRWYLWLMDTAPLQMLCVAPVAGAMIAYGNYEGGGTEVTLPAACRRCVSVVFPGWGAEAVPLPPERLDEVTARQLNPYTAATDARPVAVMRGDGRSVHCWPTLPAGRPATIAVRGVADTGEDIYEFDESAMATLAPYLHQHYKPFD